MSSAVWVCVCVSGVGVCVSGVGCVCTEEVLIRNIPVVKKMLVYKYHNSFLSCDLARTSTHCGVNGVSK